MSVWRLYPPSWRGGQGEELYSEAAAGHRSSPVEMHADRQLMAGESSLCRCQTHTVHIKPKVKGRE